MTLLLKLLYENLDFYLIYPHNAQVCVFIESFTTGSSGFNVQNKLVLFFLNLLA